MLLERGVIVCELCMDLSYSSPFLSGMRVQSHSAPGLHMSFQGSDVVVVVVVVGTDVVGGMGRGMGWMVVGGGSISTLVLWW